MQLSIVTPEGYAYDVSWFGPEPTFPEGSLLPGQKARGNVAFEIPGQIGTMYLEFDPIVGADPVRVKLQ